MQEDNIGNNNKDIDQYDTTILHQMKQLQENVLVDNDNDNSDTSTQYAENEQEELHMEILGKLSKN